MGDTASYSMTTAVSMWHTMWKASGIPKELHITREDLPFEGSKQSSTKTDDTMHTLKNSHATLHSLRVYAPATKGNKLDHSSIIDPLSNGDLSIPLRRAQDLLDVASHLQL